MSAQRELNFSFSQNQIVIKKEKSTDVNITVYIDEISENQISSSTPILGKTIQKENEILFIPVIPFGLNLTYTIIFNEKIAYFTIPVPSNYKRLGVTNIYPSDSLLPSNLLKWYIKFSKPVNKANIYDHIHIITSNRDTLSRAILSLENVLISENKTLLTIWMEPGRQKRGLIPNEELGPIFKEKEVYNLVISRQLKDDQGVAMETDYIHQFRITAADRVKPSLKNWKLITPQAKTVSSLRIHCSESLDYGSSIGNITVLNDDQIEIKGSWKLMNQEAVLSFTPQNPWKKGSYQVLFSSKIEDLAGNNLNRLFDHIIDNDRDHTFNSEIPTLEFIIE